MKNRKLALVTGGNRGIGLEVVRQLLSRNISVILSCRSYHLGEMALESLGESSEHLTLLQMDVSDDVSVMKAATEFGKHFDKLDILINNAAILLDGAESILTVCEEDLNRTWNTNTLGPLRVMRSFLPFLRESDDARVINVSSLAGQLKDMGSWAPAYSVSKTALNAITCLLANELEQDGIPVNAISPGWIRTRMGGSEAPGTLEEGSDTIVWLSVEAPRALTGKFLSNRKVTDW